MAVRVLGVNINNLTDKSHSQLFDLLEALAAQFTTCAEIARVSRGVVEGSKAHADRDALMQLARQQQIRLGRLYAAFIATYTRESCEYAVEEAIDMLSDFQEWCGQMLEAASDTSLGDIVKRVGRIDKTLWLHTILLQARRKVAKLYDEVAIASTPLQPVTASDSDIADKSNAPRTRGISNSN